MPNDGIREDEQSGVFVAQAHVRATGEATDDELLKLVMKRAPDPSVFDSNPPFTWQAECSSGRLDAYYTRMDNASLKNYVRDADAGVMFLDSHDKRQLGFGQSVRGQFIAASGKVDDKVPSDDDVSRVLIDFYTIAGLKLGRADSDSFIAGVRSGVIHDVSIGFLPDRFECNLCRADPFDWWSMECMHIPGAYYDSTGKNVVSRKSEGAILAFAWVRDARLLEVSAVYDGATPGAYIQKAKFLAEAGEVSRATATILERQLRIKLPVQAMSVPVLKTKDGSLVLERGDEVIIDGVRYGEGMQVLGKTFRKLNRVTREQDDETPEITAVAEDETVESESVDATVDAEQIDATVENNVDTTETDGSEEEDVTTEEQRQLEEQARQSAVMVAGMRAAFGRAGRKDAETVDPIAVIDEMATQIRELAPRAKLGDDWRSRVISEALDAGVRAEGNDFDRAGYEETFGAMTVAQIERLGKTWTHIAEQNLPSGGRKTSDASGDPKRLDGDARVNGTTDGELAQFVTR